MRKLKREAKKHTKGGSHMKRKANINKVIAYLHSRGVSDVHELAKCIYGRDTKKNRARLSAMIKMAMYRNHELSKIIHHTYGKFMLRRHNFQHNPQTPEVSRQ